MNGISEIFQSISNTEVPKLKDYINALNEHQTFRLNDISTSNATIQHITELLNKPETRFKGLLFLPAFINQTSLDVLEQKGNIWANLCLKVCLQKNDDVAIAYAYNALSLLIEKSVNIPELTKSFTSSLIGRICETLNYCQPNSYLAPLKCLEYILRLYPAQCGGSFRGVIEKFLIKFVDSDEISLVFLSGKCSQLMQQVRGGGVQGVSQKTAWQNYHIQLLGSLHRLLDLIYANCPETFDESTESQELKLPPLELSDEPVERASQLAKRFKNILIYLNISIREPYPVSKAFVPKKILNLLSRGLAVNSEAIRMNPISDNIAVGALLPDIHIQLFKVLDSLILVLKTHLALYYKDILGLILNSLKWTSTGKSCGFSKPYKSLRITTYNTLTLWCKTMKFGSCVEIYYEHFIKFIDNDISPFQSEITLQVLSGTKKHMSKKARKQLHKAQNEKSHLAQTHSKSSDIQNIKTVYSDQDNQLLCSNALQCFREILIYASTFLKPIMIKETQIKLIQISIHLKEIFTSSSSTTSVLLYANPSCRQNLYDVLCTLVMASHHLCPPPAQLIVHLLAQAHTIDPNPTVRDACAKNLQSLEKIMHPQKECLYFPPDAYELRNALIEKPHTVTDIASDEPSDEEDVLSDNVENSLLKNTEKESELEGNVNLPAEINSNDLEIRREDLVLPSPAETRGDSNHVVLDEDESNSVIEETVFDNKNDQSRLDLSNSSKRKNVQDEIIITDSSDDDNTKPMAKKICFNEAEPKQETNSQDVERTSSPSLKQAENVSGDKMDDDKLLNEIVSTFVDELNIH